METTINREQRVALIVALLLIFIAVMLRVLPHPANFAPIAAIAIFGGAVLPRKISIWVPLGAMIISDAIIGTYDIMPVIWACYFLTALASSLWLRKPSVVKTAALTLSASIFFFIVTNFAVWFFDSMYDHTWAGLMQCYDMALPFFRNTILSDAMYTTALFALYASARQVARYIAAPVQKHI